MNGLAFVAKTANIAWKAIGMVHCGYCCCCWPLANARVDMKGEGGEGGREREIAHEVRRRSERESPESSTNSLVFVAKTVQ